MRMAMGLLAALCLASGAARAQDADTANDVKKGHELAAIICATCHVAAADQRFPPQMKPPAPSFESIAQRPTTSADTIKQFMNTTHRGLDSPKGMPNPYLADYQIKEVSAYILSLRK